MANEQENNDASASPEPAANAGAPIIPEVMPDEKPTETTAVMPMSEWNKLYQGHIEFKSGYVGRELSIADRRTSLLTKLDAYDKMLETMNKAIDGEVDRLSQFKKERFGA